MEREGGNEPKLSNTPKQYLYVPVVERIATMKNVRERQTPTQTVTYTVKHNMFICIRCK